MCTVYVWPREATWQQSHHTTQHDTSTNTHNKVSCSCVHTRHPKIKNYFRAPLHYHTYSPKKLRYISSGNSIHTPVPGPPSPPSAVLLIELSIRVSAPPSTPPNVSIRRQLGRRSATRPPAPGHDPHAYSCSPAAPSPSLVAIVVIGPGQTAVVCVARSG